MSGEKMRGRVVVVGGGASGTAAAFAAREAGADVAVALGRPGATSLSSGAIDGDAADREARPEIGAFAAALGIWELAEGEPCRVLTVAGIARTALGRDASLLDASAVSAGVVAVARAPRAGWDADLLARAWTHEPWAAAKGIRFEPADVDVLGADDERAIPDVDLAERHDDPQRAAWLVDRLKHAGDVQRAAAIVLGPWLGLRRPLGRELCAALGKPVGEPLSLPGGPAGLRFERARDDLFARRHIATIDDELTSIEIAEQRVLLRFSSGAEREAETVVLAVGGVSSGAMGWRGLAGRGWLGDAAPLGTGFSLSFAAPAALALNDAPLGLSGSPEGALFDAYAWGGGVATANLERVGIWTTPDGRARTAAGEAIASIFCAGDAVSGAPRTMLQAVRSGLAAGRAAARAAS
ncbi:MAG TPA: FAD-binding protein [Polyangiaceae bacterium]